MANMYFLPVDVESKTLTYQNDLHLETYNNNNSYLTRTPQYLQLKQDFLSLLKDTSGLDRHSRWSDTKKKIDSDARYKAIESSSRREDYFRDYIRHLKEEKSSSRSSEGKSRSSESKKERSRERSRDKEEDVSGVSVVFCAL